MRVEVLYKDLVYPEASKIKNQNSEERKEGLGRCSPCKRTSSVN